MAPPRIYLFANWVTEASTGFKGGGGALSESVMLSFCRGRFANICNCESLKPKINSITKWILSLLASRDIVI